MPSVEVPRRGEGRGHRPGAAVHPTRPLRSIVQVADQQVDDQNLGPGITRRGGFRFIFAPFRWPRARVIEVNS